MFSERLDLHGLSRMKWEYEIARTGDAALLSFGTADMDFKSPEPILNAIRNVADKGHLGYPFIQQDYYDTIHSWLMRTTGWNVNVKECTANNVGIYTGIWTLLDALSAPGDEVIIQTPVHQCFEMMLDINQRKMITNPLKEVDGRYCMDFDHLEKCITEKTKLFWLCNPHNPVGRAWDKEELMRLGEICVRNNIYIISDDVYCGLIYPECSYVPIASLSEEISQRTVTSYSTSKSYNTTGVKYSFVITENPELLKKYQYSLQKLDLTYGFNIFGIAITIAAYRECDPWLKELMGFVQENHHFVEDYLKKHMPEVRVSSTNATYFAWLDMSSLKMDSHEIAPFFEREAHMIVGDGTVLGPGGESHIRLNLACTREMLKEGMDRMCAAYWKHIQRN